VIALAASPPRTERDLGELTTRLQHQVNELVERVTGIRQVKRQYLTLGLSVGVLIGVVLGVLIGMLMHSVTDGNNKD
jgi:tetrahydromethanopterin S-methyltransferase subunit G